MKAAGRGLAIIAALLCAVTTAAAENPKVLRMLSGTLPEAWGNPYSQSSVTPLSFWSMLFDPLVLLRTDGELQPWLATSWRQTGPNAWEIKLREGVVFSNGEPFTAAAVKVGVDYLRSPAGETQPVARDLSIIAGARVIDDRTVELTTSAPDPLLPRKLSLFRVVAPKQWLELGPAAFAQNPAGTGPYRMVRNEAIGARLAAVLTSWRKAPTAEIELIKSNDPVARRGALLSGRADFGVGGAVAKDDIPDMEAAGFKILNDHVPAVVTMVFNNVRETPFRDRRVREAVTLAVDRKTIVDVFLGQYSVVASQPARRTAFGYNKAIEALPFDPARAKALLAEAGYPNGFAFDMEMPGGTVIYVNVFQRIADDLARIGVRMTVKSVPPQLFLGNIQTGDWRSEAMAIPFYSPVNDALYPMRQHSCLWPAAWYCDQETTRMIEDAQAEPDLDRRREKTEALMARVASEHQALFLYETIQFGAYTAKIKEIKSDLGFIHYEDMVWE